MTLGGITVPSLMLGKDAWVVGDSAIRFLSEEDTNSPLNVNNWIYYQDDATGVPATDMTAEKGLSNVPMLSRDKKSKYISIPVTDFSNLTSKKPFQILGILKYMFELSHLPFNQI